MSNIIDGYPAICHGLSDGPGLSCKAVPNGSSINAVVTEENGTKKTIAILSYQDMKVSLTGVNDRYVAFCGKSGDKEITLQVPDKSIIGQIEALGVSGAFIASLNQIKKSNTKRSLGRWGIFLTLMAITGLCVLIVVLAFNWVVSKSIDLIPTSMEQELGRSSASQILTEKKVCSDPELTKAITEIGTRLVGGMGANPYQFKLRVLDDPTVNAFALPGGYVFINRGLIEQANDGYEVAGVISHEFQHVLGRHGLNNVVRQAGMMILLSTVFGDLGQLEKFIMYEAANLTSMSFSRDQETEADVKGLQLMYKAKLDVSGLSRFLVKLASEEGNPGELTKMFSTHPTSDGRVEEINKQIKASPQTDAQPLQFNWDEIKNRCSPVEMTDPDL